MNFFQNNLSNPHHHSMSNLHHILRTTKNWRDYHSNKSQPTNIYIYIYISTVFPLSDQNYHQHITLQTTHNCTCLLTMQGGGKQTMKVNSCGLTRQPEPCLRKQDPTHDTIVLIIEWQEQWTVVSSQTCSRPKETSSMTRWKTTRLARIKTTTANGRATLHGKQKMLKLADALDIPWRIRDNFALWGLAERPLR